MKICPNCSSVLESHFLYCPNCGQTADLPRFNIWHILNEFFQALFSMDKGVLFLIKNLTLQPGVTAREYVIDKKRKKYFNPFSFLLLVLGLNISVNSLIKPYTKDYTVDRQIVQPIKPVTPKEWLPYIERRREATRFIEENINIVGLAAIPLFAFVFWLCFRRTGINYSEHLVAQVFFSSFFSLVSVVLTLLLGLVLQQYVHFLNDTLLFFQLIYLTVAYYQFLAYKRPIQYLKTSGATILALVSWVATSGGAIILYIQFGS